MTHPLQILKDELANDPLVRGYSGMSDQQAADSLNLVNRPIVIPFVSGVAIGACLDVTEFSALTTAQQAVISAMFSALNIPTATGFFRAYLLARFPGGSVSRTALLAAFSRTISRAQELAEANAYDNFIVRADHVTQAKVFTGG